MSRTRSGRVYQRDEAAEVNMSETECERSPTVVNEGSARGSIQVERHEPENGRLSRCERSSTIQSHSTRSSKLSEMKKKEIMNEKLKLIAQRIENEKIILELENELIKSKQEALELKLNTNSEERISKCTNLEFNERNSNKNLVENWLNSNKNSENNSVISYEQNIPNELEKHNLSEIGKLTRAITDVMNRVGSKEHNNEDRVLARLTSKHLPPFDGQPMEWLRFKHSYEVSTRTGQYTDEENITRLQHCLRGEARNAVLAQLMTATTPAQIMKTLQLRFGRPETVVEKLIHDIRKVPRLSGSQSDLIYLATKVDNCVAAMNATGYLDYLHSPELLKEIIRKFTEALVLKWHDFLALKQIQLGEPRLPLIAQFLMQEAERAYYAGTVDIWSKSRNYERQNSKQTYFMSKKEHYVKNNKNVSNNEVSICLYCLSPEHNIARCENFKSISVDDRWDWAKDKKVCFICLCNTHRRHLCKEQKCKICTSPHHELLHQIRREEIQEVTIEEKSDEEVQLTSNIWSPEKKKV